MVRWLRRCIRLRSDVSEVRFLPGPRRADVLETGDFSGDKLGGLTDSGDEAVTSGDMLGGLEFAAFPTRKRKTEQSGRLEPAFHRKPANLEARASHLQSDTKNGLFGLDRFERFFAPKTKPDGAVTSVVTSSAG